MMMTYGRLTTPLEHILQTRPLHPVIIKTRPRRLSDIASVVWDYMSPIAQMRAGVFTGELLPNIFEHRVVHRWNMTSGILPRDLIEDLAQDRNVLRIYPDKQMYIMRYPTVPPDAVGRFIRRGKYVYFTSTYWTKQLLGAPAAHKMGIDGNGVNVAVLDTGASRVHEQIRHNVVFSTEIRLQHRDENGHGNWCATCIGGARARDDALSRLSNKQILCEGVAPGVRMQAIKVLGYVVGTGATSTIIQGLEAAIDRGANVISMSLGGEVTEQTQDEDPFYEPMCDIASKGVIPVVAAGNSGPKGMTIGSPGWLDCVLTVGAYDPLTGSIADFSSRGPTIDNRIKPDVVAPGVMIDSGTVGVLDYAADGIENRYSPLSGTSMATPHVAGLVALMKQAKPDLTVYDIFKMMQDMGAPKSNIDGWGPITWQMFTEYFGVGR